MQIWLQMLNWFQLKIYTANADDFLSCEANFERDKAGMPIE